jgi:hypothetical protein
LIRPQASIRCSNVGRRSRVPGGGYVSSSPLNTSDDPDWSAASAAATLENDDDADLPLEAGEYSTAATYGALNGP